MKLKARLQVTLGGVLIILMGIAYYQRHGGALPYLNWRRQPVFPMGGVVAGILVCALAWLPQKWIARWSRTQQPREGHVLQYLDQHNHKHGERHRPST